MTICAYIRTAKGLPDESEQRAAIEQASGAAVPDDMIWLDKGKRGKAPPSFEQRDYMVQAARDGDTIWIARHAVIAATEAGAQDFLIRATKAGAILCVASSGRCYRWHPDAAEGIQFAKDVRADGRASVLEKARESRRKLGRQTHPPEAVEEARRLWGDQSVTVADAEARSGISHRTMYRWWGPKGTPKFGKAGGGR